MADFMDVTLHGERIVLESGQVNYLIRTTLDECEVVNQTTARNLAFANARFVKCKIVAKRSFENVQFYKAAFIDCTFLGRYTGCDFGRASEDIAPAVGTFGAVEDCDFSGATLHACRFVGCDVSRLRLPGAPHILILPPFERAVALAQQSWPGKLCSWFRVMANGPAGTVARVVHRPTLCKELEITEEELGVALKALGVVVT